MEIEKKSGEALKLYIQTKPFTFPIKTQIHNKAENIQVTQKVENVKFFV